MNVDILYECLINPLAPHFELLCRTIVNYSNKIAERKERLQNNVRKMEVREIRAENTFLNSSRDNH